MGWHPVAVVQHTFINSQYIEQHNRHKQYMEQHNSLIRKSLDRVPSLRVTPWHLSYNWRKNTEKPESLIYIYIITDKSEDKLHIFTTYMSMLAIFKIVLLSDVRNSANRALDIAILILF